MVVIGDGEFSTGDCGGIAGLIIDCVPSPCFGRRLWVELAGECCERWGAISKLVRFAFRISILQPMERSNL